LFDGQETFAGGVKRENVFKMLFMSTFVSVPNILWFNKKLITKKKKHLLKLKCAVTRELTSLVIAEVVLRKTRMNLIGSCLSSK